MEKETKICPYCGEEIEITATKCCHCGEMLDKSFKIKLPSMNPVSIMTLIITLCIIVIIAVIVNLSTNGMNFSYGKVQVLLTRAFKNLNHALIVRHSKRGIYSDTPEKLKETLYTTMINVNTRATNEDYIVDEDGITYTIKPLNAYCGALPENGDYGSETACAEIIIDINGNDGPNKYKKDQFSLYAYMDQVEPKRKSIEAKMIYRE